MKRILALLGAVALVLAAVLIRNAIDGSDDDPDVSGDTDGSLSLTCGPELLAVCNALAESDDRIVVTIEDEAATASKVASGGLEAEPDWAWLTAGDWVSIARAGGEVVPDLKGSDVLGRSPAVIVAKADRMEVLSTSCVDVDWACIGGSAGQPWDTLGGSATWGPIKVALPTPDDGEGTVSVNQAVASMFTGGEFASNDLSIPQVSSWFDQLATQSNANSAGTSPLDEFIRRPGSLSVVGAIESEAVSRLGGVASAGDLVVIAPDPVVTADVQLWAGSTDVLDRALATLRDAKLVDALATNGWRLPDSDGAYPDGDALKQAMPSSDSIKADMRSFESALPASSGLPAPGVVSAVNTRWEDTR